MIKYWFTSYSSTTPVYAIYFKAESIWLRTIFLIVLVFVSAF